jgi:hypothetical protein
MTYVIGYKNDAMANPTIVYGPFSSLVQAINGLPKTNIESYKVYQLVEVTHTEDNNNDTNKELKEVLKELYEQ